MVFRMVELVEGAQVQYLAKYVLKWNWGGAGSPDVGFIEVSPDLLEVTETLYNILWMLIEAGRIDWVVDDAPYIHGWLEQAQAAILSAKGELPSAE